MQPRRSDSKKWTSLPKEYLENIHTAITAQYKKELKNVEVVVEGRVYDREVLVRIGFLPNGRLKQHNFELAFDVPEAKDQVLTKLNTSLDFLGSVFIEFFAKDGFENSEYEETLPILWKPVSFSKDVLHFQYSTVNSKLESLADEWLSKQDEALVNENRTEDSGMDAYNFAEQYDAETLEKIIELKKTEKALTDDNTTLEGDQHLH
tara:strand:+ start:58995 stop:59612 length:618 start_codon:yes stop_codon:yes gene_type:complete